MRARFPVLLTLLLGVLMIVPVTGLPGLGPKAVPTRVQTLELADIAMAGGQGMSGVENPTASRSAVVETKPFGLVGLSWDTAPPAGSLVKVRVREDAGWTAWMPVPYSADHGPDPGSDEDQQARAGSDPLLTGRSDALQVWVQTPDGQAPPHTQIHLVDTDNVDIQQVPGSQAAAAPGMPQIITRAQWGADESMRNRGPIYSDVVKVGFVHHTVSSSTYSPEEAAAQMRNLYAWYTKGLKYSDMAYNFLVDRFGRLYEGRYGGMAKPVVGGHTAGLNTDSFAVSAMGNFEEYNPDSEKMNAMKESIAKLMAWKLGLSNRDPGGKDSLVSNGSLGSGFWDAGETATLNRVSGHRDAGNTACPGKYLYAHVGQIRSRASEIFKQKGSPSPAPQDPDVITPAKSDDTFRFRGSGSGDGVGVPRAGVLGQARDGRKAGTILKHYLTGVAVQKVRDDKVITMDLGSRRQVTLDTEPLAKGAGGYSVSGKSATAYGDARTTMRAATSDGAVVVERKKGGTWRQVIKARQVVVHWAGTRDHGKLSTKATVMQAAGTRLRAGSVVLTAAGQDVRASAKVRVRDEYLPFLAVAPNSWPPAALQAMAIAYRSRALAAPWNADCACHVSTESFAGQGAATAKGYASWRKAVTSTSRGTQDGVVVTYKSAPVAVPVFEASGGATLNASDVRKGVKAGSDMPWARSVKDPWSLQPKNTRYASWSARKRTPKQVAQAFGLPDVVTLKVKSRLTGGAVATIVATSSKGKTASLSGEELRVRLDLPSAFIAQRRT